VNVTDPNSVNGAVKWCEEATGGINGLVCSAGTALEKPFLET